MFFCIRKKLLDDFNLLSSVENKYNYILQYSQYSPFFPYKKKKKLYKISGCLSSTWCFHIFYRKRIFYFGFSESQIIFSFICFFRKIILNKFDNISRLDLINVFNELGLFALISISRQGGAKSIINHFFNKSSI